MEAMIEHLVEILTELMVRNVWFAPLLSLAAGIATSFTPCSLSAVPMVLAYMEGTQTKGRKKALKLSVTMAFGMALTFAVFGSAATALGHLMHEAGRWWGVLMGILMLLMAFQIWEVWKLFPSGRRRAAHTHSHSHVHGEECCECTHPPKKIRGRGYAGAFLTGALGGVFASHCAAPVMVALLALVAQAGKSALWGSLLMALFAAGHSLLLILAGTSYSAIDRWIKNPKSGKIGSGLRLAVGAVIFLAGIGMLLTF